jgi:hypothetical protein
VVDDPSIVKAQAGAAPDKVGKAKAPSKPLELADNDTIARQRLENNSMDSEFADVPLDSVFEYMSDTIGVQFYIDKQSLEGASIRPDAPITLSLKKVPAEMVLDLILRQLKLDYRLRNGVVMVASAADVQAQTEVRVYRVREGMAEELAALIPDTIDAHLWSGHTVITDPRGRRRAGYGSMDAPSGGYGGGRYGSSAGGYGAGGPGEGEVAETVGGGGAGTIRVFRGTLVISQTPEVHQKIEKLLDDLTGAGAMDPQKRSDGPGVDRTGMMPGGPPQEAIAGESGYGQAGQSGYGGTGYGQTGQPGYGRTGRGQPGYGRGGYGSTTRGGYGATGGSRGGYGSAASEGGSGTAGPRRGQGDSSSFAPEGGNLPGQPPSSGGFAPVPQDPNAPSGAPLGPSSPGRQPPGTNDPNATQSGAAPAGGGSPPGLGASGGIAPNTPRGESGGSTAAPAAPSADAAAATPIPVPSGSYGGAR